VYRRKHGTWTLTATLTAPPGRPIQNFALTNALKYANGIVAVGVTYQDDFTSGLLLYRLNGAGQLVGVSQLASSDPDIRSMGWAADLNAQTLVATASTTTNESVVLVFKRSGNQWTQVQRITSPEQAGFGAVVALHRNGLLVSAPGAQPESAQDTSDGHSASGAVYAYVKRNGLYTYRLRLRPTPDQLFDYYAFGTSITVDGDRAVIGASEPPSFLYANGVAIVYERHGDQAVATALARFDDTWAMSLSGNQLLLGSPYFVDYDDNNTFYLTGFADFYTLPPISE
jgi:hypothetical protein